jgi:hypothetical protein
VAIPSSGTSPTGINAQPNRDIWIVDNNTDRISRFDLPPVASAVSAVPNSDPDHLQNPQRKNSSTHNDLPTHNFSSTLQFLQ